MLRKIDCYSHGITGKAETSQQQGSFSPGIDGFNSLRSFHDCPRENEINKMMQKGYYWRSSCLGSDGRKVLQNFSDCSQRPIFFYFELH